MLHRRDFGGRKPKQLLQLLALHSRGLSKERLAELMWDGRAPANVSATVEHYACVLRRALATPGRPGSTVIVSEPGGYRLDRQVARVDIDRFDALMAAMPDSAACEAALAIAVGDLLEDEPYAAWAVSARVRYRMRCVQLLLDAAQSALLVGDATRAVSLAERAVGADLLNERAYQMLVVGHYVLDDQRSALAAYHRCRVTLAAEVGVDPLPVTKALFDGVLQQVPVIELLSRAQRSAV
nr:BTAD domain-containing putative transcriptional regulator [uncultured Actinoplanes sp.]